MTMTMPMPLLASPGDAAMSPTDVSAGAGRSTSGGSVADERRARHRVLVKRAYHQKLGALQALRQHERELDAQCRTLSRMHANVTPPPSVATDTDCAGHLRDLYARLAVVRAELERENRTLQRLTDEHARYRALLKREAVTITPTAVPFVAITPMTKHQCDDVISAAYETVRRFESSNDTLSLGSKVFGWTHRYRYQDNGRTLQYSIGKTFPGTSAAVLCQRSWEILSSSELYRSLHSASVRTARVHVVQRVTADSAVLFRVLRRRGHRVVHKTLFVASQLQEPDGCIIIYRSVDPKAQHLEHNFPDDDESEDEADTSDRTEAETVGVVWLDMFAWMRFQDTRDDVSSSGGVHFEFGGTMPHTSQANAQFWMLEVLLLALRWETTAVGPLFTLTSD